MVFLYYLIISRLIIHIHEPQGTSTFIPVDTPRRFNVDTTSRVYWEVSILKRLALCKLDQEMVCY